jgi:predicted XRE-type DNA-binding protein
MSDKATLQAAVSRYLIETPISQDDLAKQVGVSQSVVSRAKNGQWKLYSRSLRRLGEHVQARPSGVDPRKSELLMSALGRLWDGTPEQERRLVELLLSVGEFRVES